VRIARVDGVGQQAEGEATVHSADGRERFSVRFETNDIGQANVSIPGEAMQPGARLSVAASPLAAGVDFVERKKLADRLDDVEDRLESRVSSLTAELPVRQEPQVRYFFFENPVAEAGQSNQFALWSFGAISATPVPADISGARSKSGSTAVSQPMWSADGSFVTGEVPVPESAEQTNYRLAFRDTKGDRFHAPVDGVVMQQERQNRVPIRAGLRPAGPGNGQDAADTRLRAELRCLSCPSRRCSWRSTQPPAPPAPAQPGAAAAA
jgi:hypothetical protein